MIALVLFDLKSSAAKAQSLRLKAVWLHPHIFPPLIGVYAQIGSFQLLFVKLIYSFGLEIVCSKLSNFISIFEKTDEVEQ